MMDVFFLCFAISCAWKISQVTPPVPGLDLRILYILNIYIRIYIYIYMYVGTTHNTGKPPFSRGSPIFSYFRLPLSGASDLDEPRAHGDAEAQPAQEPQHPQGGLRRPEFVSLPNTIRTKRGCYTMLQSELAWPAPRNSTCSKAYQAKGLPSQFGDKCLANGHETHARVVGDVS